MQFPWVSRKKYDEVVHKLESLLWFATGGILSKADYSIVKMFSYVDDHIQKSCNEAVEESLAERKVRYTDFFERMKENAE